MVGNAQTTMGRLVLLRHGQTIWAQSGQHTGRTDIPLTPVGCQQAQDAGRRLQLAFPKGFEEDCVWVSPLCRARQTARLAGFSHAHQLDSVMEWDYGAAEGRTRQTVAQLNGAPWDVWKHGPKALPMSMVQDSEETFGQDATIMVHRTSGESLEEVSERTQQVIDTVLPKLQDGKDVLLVAHAHILRILTARWLRVPAEFAKLLRLDTAHFSVLGEYKGDRVIVQWNC